MAMPIARRTPGCAERRAIPGLFALLAIAISSPAQAGSGVDPAVPGASPVTGKVTRDPLASPEPARSASAAWFNLRLPGPETDPAAGPFADLELPARPAVFGPGPMDPRLSGDAIRTDVAEITGFATESRAAGDYLWGRITGRPGYDRTIGWVAAQLAAAGLKDAHLEPFRPGAIPLPVAGELRLIGSEAMGAGSRDIVLRSAMVQGIGPVDGTIAAPLVYVGQGMEADLAGRDLRGRIAVTFATPDPSLYAPVPSRRSAAMIAAGAVGVIEILAQPGNLKGFDRDRHGCGQGLCFTIGGADGFFLQSLLGRAAVEGKTVLGRLSARSVTIDRPIANVVATLPGRSESVVIVDAHADGWFGGADDNATGLAIMVALARHFAALGPQARSLVFVASAGHHSAGANGLAAFRRAHDHDFVARADLILNIEHPAQSATMRSYVDRQDGNFGFATIAASGELPKQIAVNNRAPFLVDLWRQGIRCFGLDAQRRVDAVLPGELKAFADRPDIPQTQMIASGNVYHTSGDDLVSVPSEGLERAARFYAFLIAEAANAPAALLRGGAWAQPARCPATP